MSQLSLNKCKSFTAFILFILYFSTPAIGKNYKYSNQDEKDTFLAAAYEHVTIPANPKCYLEVCERDEALSSMIRNLQIYEEESRNAKELGAEIIVFPEFGIVPFLPRDKIRPFSEYIPSNDEIIEDWIPCDDSSDDSGFKSQKLLSCIAKENEMFVVANMVDFQICDECGEDYCLYNTIVIYDKYGRYLAKYHKYNLFNSEVPIFNIDKETQNVYVDTELGRLGLIVCEDLLWYYPTDDLVKTSGVDTILFSTKWTDVYPYFLAHANQESRAKSLQVNLLGSNVNGPSPQNTGSGIYTTQGAINYYHNVSLRENGKLVIGELPIHPMKLSTPVEWNKYTEENGHDYPIGETQFQAFIHDDPFIMVEMDPNQNKAKICSSENDSFCCIARYDYSLVDTDGIFSLGVFKGIYHHNESVRGIMANSICTIVKCNSNTPDLCDTEDYSYSGQSQTYFTELELSGSFEPTTSVYPQLVFNEFELHPELEKILPDGRITLNLDNNDITNIPFVSMTLFGRRPLDDGPAPDNWCPH